MEIIAIDEMAIFLQRTLPKYSQPVMEIYSTFYAGCSKCNSNSSVFTVSIKEKPEYKDTTHVIKIIQHKLPIPIFFINNQVSPIPKKIWIGTIRMENEIELKIRKLTYND